MTQPRLFGSDAPALLVTPLVPLNYSVHREERPRLQRQSIAIIERLRQGPASNAELATLAMNLTARISEGRKAGFDIRISARDRRTGWVLYRLVSEPPA